MANILQPIIRRLESYGDYPFEAIEPSALLLLEEANATLAFEQKKQFEVLKRSLECFLQITDQRLSSITIGRPEFSDTYRSFVGALNSERFVDRPLSWRYTMTRAMNALVIALRVVKKAPKIHTFSVKSNALTTDIKSCVLEFDSLVLNEERVWCWRGWVSYNKSGNPIFLPLYPVYKRLGRDFTDRFFAVCNGFLTARRQSQFSCLKPLAKFIGLYEKQFGPSDFCDPQFTTDFWRDFFSFYLVIGYANGDGSKVSTLVSEWRKNLTHFVSEYLQPSGLFAEPWGQFPSPEPKYVSGARTYVRTTSEGHDVKTKLLTDIPLHVSDEEALELLFHRIEADVNVFANWAEWAAKSIWSRYQRRRELETKGTAREIQKKGIWHCGDLIWKTGRKNPEHLTNAAATLAHHGFLCSSDITLSSLYPLPLRQTAQELALPVTDALFPHCVLLVIDHPSITPAFLECLELFDRSGKQTGFVSTSSGSQLIGYKHRSGPKHAQQIIELTQRAAEIVVQIIALTQPLRQYLKSKHDDRWRYLLLTCKQGFAYPAPIKNLSQTTIVPIRVKLLAESLGNTCDYGFDKRMEYASKFSLPALRASAGVLVYLKTGSAEAMSKALGHAKYDHSLLSCYLPEPVLNFFQERWVRIFQTGIIVEAMKDSEYLLSATEFRDMGELDTFLHNHALRALPLNFNEKQESERVPRSSDKEVVFGVGIGILTALVSLDLAVERSSRQVCAKAKYWAGIAKHLTTYIEAELSNRIDLQAHLATAREKADPLLMQHLLYG